MKVSLKPCPYRLVDSDGRILCNQVKTGERQVSAETCQACPVAEIDCVHLRATLHHKSCAPLTVRWGNGKNEVWSDPAPYLILERAACVVKTIPILSPHDCAGCTLRQALIPAATIHVMPNRQPIESKVGIGSASEGRTNVVSQKLIRLQEWLGQKKGLRAQEEEPGMLPRAFGARSVRSVAEERRVGWTD